MVGKLYVEFCEGSIGLERVGACSVVGETKRVVGFHDVGTQCRCKTVGDKEYAQVDFHDNLLPVIRVRGRSERPATDGDVSDSIRRWCVFPI